MAKLSLLPLTFATIIVLASVSAFRTTVYTTTVEEDDVLFTRKFHHQTTCRREIESEEVNDCRKYITSQSHHASDVIKMTVQNPRQEEEKEQCCQELREVEEECQCRAVQKAFQEARDEQQGERHRGEQQQRQILQKARELPSECNLEIQKCRIRYSWF